MTTNSKPITVLEQNRLEAGVTLSITSTNTDAPGNSTLSLSDFLRRFETPKERALVRTAVHVVLRASRG